MLDFAELEDPRHARPALDSGMIYEQVFNARPTEKYPVACAAEMVSVEDELAMS